MNTLPRASRNLFGYARAVREMLRVKSFRTALLDATQRFDVLHFNHEGLFLLAAWLRRRHGTAQTMHVRTMIPRNTFGRWQCRRMDAAIDRIVFITENERANVEGMLQRPARGRVIYNVAVPPARETTPHPAVPHDARLKIAVLANYSWSRGLDRMIDVAEALAKRGRRDVLFVMAGDMSLRGTLPGTLGQIADRGGSLADYAAARGVGEMFLFLGHVAEPEAVLAACDTLAKPTREDNPWGRDILEGLAAGKPVISIGRYERFIENGVTGYLMPEFDAEAMAEIVLRLGEDRSTARRLGEEAKRRIAALCNPADRAGDLVSVWREAIASRGTAAA